MYSAWYRVDTAMKVCCFVAIVMGVGGTGGTGGYWWMDTDGAFGGNSDQGVGNSEQNSQHNIGGGYQQGGVYQQPAQNIRSEGSNGNSYTNSGQQTGRNENRKSQNKSSVLGNGGLKSQDRKRNESGKVNVRGKSGANTARQQQNGGKKVQTTNGGGNSKGRHKSFDDYTALGCNPSSLNQ